MKKGWSKKKIILWSVLGGFALVCIVGTVLLALFVSSKDYVKFDEEKLLNFSNNLTIIDCNGAQISQSAYINNRKITDIDTLNKHTTDAFISIEDRRFYSHNGVDYKAIARAIVNNIKANSLKEGASTISQQLIKNTHLVDEKTYKRKLNETFLARQLEKRYSKEQILEMYLNTVYFGGNCFGIESASNTYFGKTASNLSLAESATLAGLLKAPNTYSPLQNSEKCIVRRNIVLTSMAQNGFITQEAADLTIKEPLTLTEQQNGTEKDYIYAVISEACALLNMSPQQIYCSGLTISTYYDEMAQCSAKNAVCADLTLTEKGEVPQKTAIIIDNQSCGISAFYSVSPYDVLTQKRSIGSVIKPIGVYAPAIEMGEISPCTPIFDGKVTFGNYTPKNYGNKFHGWITTQTALTKSLNVPAIKVLNSIGMGKSAEFLRKNGIEITEKDKNLTLALGTLDKGIDVVTLANSYLTLANGGNYATAGTISQISNDKGTIYVKKNGENKVFSPSTAFLITDMLKNAVNTGTALKLSSLPYQIAAKTGTVGNSQHNTDALICGYTSRHTFAVLISEANDKLPINVTGGNQPTEICKNMLSKMYADTPPANFTPPSDVIKLAIDKDVLNNSHKVVRTNQRSRNTEEYYFAANNLPKMQAESKTAIKTTMSATYKDGKVRLDVCGNTGYALIRKCQNKEILLCQNVGKTYFDCTIDKGKTYQYKLISNVDNKKVVHSRVTVGIPK